MIKSLNISNIQSHEQSLLTFHPGVNIIIGNTDSGKSAIIRALRWVIWNRPSGDSLRSRWGGKTSVEIETEDGSVVRSKDKKDEYNVNIKGQKKLLLSAFGTSVPEEVSNFLNINEINLQEQLDNHFLLGKGWTAGSVAAHFNKVANINEIDTSTSNINKKVSKLEADIEYDKAQIKEKKETLLTFEYLNTAESLLEVLEDQESRLSRLKTSVYNLRVKIDDIEEFSKTIETCKEGLIIEDQVNVILDQITRIESMKSKGFKLRILVSDIEVKKKKIQELSRYSQLSPLVTEVLKRITEKEALNHKQKALFKLLSSYRSTKTQLEAKKETYTHLLEKFSNEFPNICPLCNTNLKNHKPCLTS
jgi:DNA repair protein SbcC/Rad50